MKMRSFALLLGSVTLTALAASNAAGCIVTGSGTSGTGGTGSGSGGAGGSTTASTTGATMPTTSSSGAGGATGSTGTSTGSAMCDMAYTCAEAITPGLGDPAKLCNGTPA